MSVTLAELLESVPPEVVVDPDEIREANDQYLVVIDDDPTGTQSIASLPILTSWSEDDFAWALSQDVPAVYVMANSRSLDPSEAERVNDEITAAALAAARACGTKVTFVSRSDSTLRGHYPLEPEVIARHVDEVDGVLIVPAFPDAGRITVNSVHYAGGKGEFVPAGETEFARDATFGYRSSDLAEWVEEKTGGKVAAGEVCRVTLGELRTDLGAVTQKLTEARDAQPIVCDAVTENDLRRLALAVIAAEKAGKAFIYRTGPTFVRARIGQEPPAVVTTDQIDRERADQATKGGLVVVGSHVSVTTAQLNHLIDRRSPRQLTIDVATVVGEGRETHIDEIVSEACRLLHEDTVVISTSRELVKGSSPEESLAIARQVSSAVVEVVATIIEKTTPRFVLAKGGITSSDVAVKALAMKRAWVTGPMLPGIISMWAAADGPAHGIPYVVFPGNVGDETGLAAVVEKLES